MTNEALSDMQGDPEGANLGEAVQIQTRKFPHDAFWDAFSLDDEPEPLPEPGDFWFEFT